LTKGRLPSRTQPTRTRSRNVKKYPRNLNLELLTKCPLAPPRLSRPARAAPLEAHGISPGRMTPLTPSETHRPIGQPGRTANLRVLDMVEKRDSVAIRGGSRQPGTVSFLISRPWRSIAPRMAASRRLGAYRSRGYGPGDMARGIWPRGYGPERWVDAGADFRGRAGRASFFLTSAGHSAQSSTVTK
jgi:hypothetical protein